MDPQNQINPQPSDCQKIGGFCYCAQKGTGQSMVKARTGAGALKAPQQFTDGLNPACGNYRQHGLSAYRI